MATPPNSPQPATELAAYLMSRRDAILNKWRTVCENDSTLSHVASMTRSEFNNLIPLILNILNQRLQAQPEESDAVQVATTHGLHRWHKGRVLKDLLTASEQIARLKSETI